MKDEVISQKGPTIFQQIVVPIIVASLIAITVLQISSYFFQRELIAKELKSQFSDLLTDAVDDFNATYAFPIENDFKFLQYAFAFDYYLSAQKNEILLAKSPAERLFLSFTRRDNGIYLSLRFIDAVGLEKIVVEGNKRIKNYVSLAAAPEDALHIGISTLFSKLISKPAGTILCEDPFKFKGKWTFLVGMTKGDPEIAGTAGVLIFHCDLSKFFTDLAGVQFFGERVARVTSLNDQQMFPPESADVATSPVKNPTEKGKPVDFYDLSKEIRLSPYVRPLFNVTFRASPKVFQRGMQNVLIYSLILLFLAILFLGILIRIVSKNFSRPMRELIDSVRRFSQGDLTLRVHAKASGEVQVLGEAFDRLAENLERTMVSRDAWVKEATERKTAEDSLQRAYDALEGQLRELDRAEEIGSEHERKFRAVFDQAFQLIGLLTPEGILTAANRTALEFEGIKESDVLGKRFWETPWWTHSSEMQDQLRAAIAKASQGEFVRFEVTHPFKDGELRSLDFSLKPVKDSRGKVSLLIAESRDITDRIQANLKLKDSEDRLKVIFDYAPDAYYLFDLTGTFLDGNKAAEEICGYPKEELMGKSFMKMKLIALSDMPKAAAALARSTLGFPSDPEEYTLHRRDGSVVVAEVRLFPVKIQGKVQVLGCARDITKRKKAEEALRQAHNELEARVCERTAELAKTQAYTQQILATITDYIYTVTVKDGVAVETTHQSTCLAVTGYAADEFKTQPALWENMVYPEDRPRVLEFSAAVIAGKTVQPLEHRILRKDGTVRWVRNTPVLHMDPSGRLMSYDGILSDITDRKQAEILLIESIEKAARAHKAKDQFLSNMSHEIRTPLNAIIGFSDLLKSTSLDPVQKGYVETLRDGGETLLSLLTDVLDFSRMASGEVRPGKIHFDLERLIEGVLKAHMRKLSRKDLKIFCSMDEKVPHGFRGDPARIRQVLMHLLSNAIKFTEKGEIEVRVSLDGKMENRDPVNEAMIRIAVRDTGIGLSREKYEAVFRAFEQADVSTTRKYGGAGLGLSISRELVKLMGGTIEVQSEPGQGSVFSVLLPLEVESAANDVQIFPLKDEELSGKKILILDDDAMARKIFSYYCEEVQMVVLRSSALAQDALQWLSEQSLLPDIILADIVMPDMDGYELARKIRNNKKYETIKLVAVTGEAREGAASRAQQSGYDGYVSKPASRDNLLKVIKTVLGDRREKILPVEIVTQYTAEELSRKGLRILVVEDNPSSQELLSIILRSFDFVVEIACDGREAVEKVQKEPCDLILMDLQMPVMGGLEATRIIRKELHKTMPILALTAGVSEDDRATCLAAGMNDYLAKPIEINKLKDKIFHWIKNIS
ncbi:MAG: response regulator [Candidatus Omnitrophota bacterium]